MQTFTVDGIIKVTSQSTITIDAVVTAPSYAPPGGRTDEGGWSARQGYGLTDPRDMPKTLYTGVSQIHDQDETPRLVNKELELLDTFISGSVE